VRELETLINDFTYRNGFDTLNVFRDFLRWIIHGFSLPGTPPMQDWRYTKEQSVHFGEMFTTWVQIMDHKLKVQNWYDSFGNLFMQLQSKLGQQYRGQFFTPEHVCELMAGTIIGEQEGIPLISDPAAGSGRLLLAAHAIKPRSYLVAQDVDYVCCLMTVVNFLIHGCIGEVICMNTLTLKDFRGAWLVNEYYCRTGVPSIRFMTEQEYSNYKRVGIERTALYDQETYDQYFHYRELWHKISELFEDKSEEPKNDI